MEEKSSINSFNSKTVGFALIEVLIAILILGSSFVVLLSLQSSVIKRALRERNQQQAMLVSRSLLAAIEIDPSQLEEQDTTMAAKDMLNELLGSKGEGLDPELEQTLAPYEATLQVKEQDLPLGNQDPLLLKQIILDIHWGSDPSNQLRTIFYIPAEKSA